MEEKGGPLSLSPHSRPPLLAPFCLSLVPSMRSQTQFGHTSADVLTHLRQDARFNLSSYAVPHVS